MSFLSNVESDPAQGGHDSSIWGIDWTINDEILSIGADGLLKVWDQEANLKWTSKPPPKSLSVVSLSTSRSGSLALTNTVDGNATLYSMKNQSVVGGGASSSKLPASKGLWCSALHPSGTIWAGAGEGSVVKVISSGVDAEGRPSEAGDVFGDTKAQLDYGKKDFVMCVRYSPDGSSLAMSTQSGDINIFDVASGKLATKFSASHKSAVRTLSWSIDSQYLFSGSDDSRIVLHDVKTGGEKASHGAQAIASLSGHSSWVLSLAASPDFRLLASGSADKTIKLWDLRERSCTSTLAEPSEIWSLSWRPLEADQSQVGKQFVSGGDDKTVRFWRAAGSG